MELKEETIKRYKKVFSILTKNQIKKDGRIIYDRFRKFLIRRNLIKTLNKNYDFILLDGLDVPVQSIYRFLKLIKNKGMLAVCEDSKSFSECNDIVDFFKKSVHQNAFLIIIDGRKYIIISKMEN
jgi:hypothetical protein